MELSSRWEYEWSDGLSSKSLTVQEGKRRNQKPLLRQTDDECDMEWPPARP